MFDRIDRFVRDLRRVRTEEELAALLGEVARELGFAYFALTHHVDIRQAPQPAIRLASYPPEWVDYFDGERLGPSDPVHRPSQLTSVGCAWSHVPGESHGSCSFATRRGDPIQADALPCAQLIGAFAFEAARRLWKMRSLERPAPGLTDRQRDCLLWAARGKSDWEISRILGISRETVIQHLKQARERYGVGKRTLLAVHALFDGTISFLDIVKP